MKGVKGKFLKACFKKWRKMGDRIRIIPCAECCQYWNLWWACGQEDSSSIPEDVPKGHLVVYVGQNCKRFVIKVSLLKHPLFKALLELARDEYDFTSAYSKLWIPCDENLFLNVVCCANSPQDPTLSLCF